MESCIKQIDVLDGLAGFADKSSDIVLIDPPYNIGKDFGNTSDKMPMPEYLEWSMKWINESIRVLKDSGTLYIYGFPEILCHIASKIPLEQRWLVWHYTNKTVPGAKFWQRSYETIICCWKETDKRIFNTDEVREPYTGIFLKNAAGKKRKATPGRFSDGKTETIYTAHEKGAMPRDVINCPALAGGAGKNERWFLCKTCNDVYKSQYKEEHNNHTIVEHPTQKPYKLTERLLLAAKPEENGVVLVPFVGTGSECAVAEDLGLRYYGFEINPDYVFMANKFIENRKNATGMDYQ